MANKFPKDTDYMGIIHKLGNYRFEKTMWCKIWRTSHPMKEGKTIRDIVNSVWKGHRIGHFARSLSPHCVYRVHQCKNGQCLWEIAFGHGFKTFDY